MRRQILELTKQLGWQGICGIVLFMLGAMFYTLMLAPLEQETVLMQSQVIKSRAGVGMQGRILSLGAQQKALGQFLDSFPAEEDVTDILATIYTIAESTGVGFKQAEYRLVKKTALPMVYKITFPVQGSYKQVRYFVLRVLAEHPAMSLDQIALHRNKANNSLLRAEVSLTLFWR